jgi:hypothetical protein
MLFSRFNFIGEEAAKTNTWLANKIINPRISIKNIFPEK